MGFRRVLHGNQHPTITKSVKPGCTGLEQQRRRHRPEPAHQLDTYRAGSQITLSASTGRPGSQLGRHSQQPCEPALHVGFRRVLHGNQSQPSPTQSSPATPALSSSVEDTGQHPHTNSTPAGPALKSHPLRLFSVSSLRTRGGALRATVRPHPQDWDQSSERELDRRITSVLAANSRGRKTGRPRHGDNSVRCASPLTMRAASHASASSGMRLSTKSEQSLTRSLGSSTAPPDAWAISIRISMYSRVCSRSQPKPCSASVNTCAVTVNTCSERYRLNSRASFAIPRQSANALPLVGGGLGQDSKSDAPAATAPTSTFASKTTGSRSVTRVVTRSSAHREPG